MLVTWKGEDDRGGGTALVWPGMAKRKKRRGGKVAVGVDKRKRPDGREPREGRGSG
jgi:hypothetical protein